MLEVLPTPVVIYIYIVYGLLGLVLGSALNCLCDRMVSQEKWSGKERSVCPACGHVLSPRELIPVFSYAFQRGKCRHCGARISPRYPICELTLGLCFVSLLAVYGVSIHMLVLAVLCACMFCLSLVDLDTMLIPDRFLLIPAVLRAAELLLTEGPVGLGKALVPALILGGSVFLLSLLMDKLFKKESMGGGDIKLLAMLGMFFPLPQCLLLLILACVLGIFMSLILMHKKPGSPFPFGPAICAGAWVTLLFGEPVIRWYTGLFA